MSTDSISRVVRHANDIAIQFGHLPMDQAAAAVAAHITSFWDPRMRAAFTAAVDDDRLEPAAAAACDLLTAGTP